MTQLPRDIGTAAATGDWARRSGSPMLAVPGHGLRTTGLERENARLKKLVGELVLELK